MLHAKTLCFEPLQYRQERLPATSYGDESLIYDDNGNLSSDLVSRSHEIPMSVMEDKGKPDYIRTMRRVEYAIHHINRERQEYGEQYWLQEVVKVLEVREESLMILSFIVRDLYTDAMKKIEASVWAYAENFICNLIVWKFLTPPSSPITPPSSPEIPTSFIETLSQQYSAMGITTPLQQQNFMGLIDAQIKEWKRMGYDVNTTAPDTLDTPDTPFIVVSESMIKKYSSVRNDVMARIKVALDEINTQAQVKGQKYEFKKIVKVVEAVPYFGILAFNVKEVNTGVVRMVEVMISHEFGHDVLNEWRFK